MRLKVLPHPDDIFLGLNTGHHDSSAALFHAEGGKIIDPVIYLMERITKKKRSGFYPLKSLLMAQKNEARLSHLLPDHIGINCFADTPAEEERKILEKGANYLPDLERFDGKHWSPTLNPDMNFVTHHLAHAWTIFPQCIFEEALIIVFDGMGNFTQAFSSSHTENALLPGERGAESLSVYHLKAGTIFPIEKVWMTFRNKDRVEEIWEKENVGSVYGFAGEALFGSGLEAGKVMGLSAYGNTARYSSEEVKKVLRTKYSGGSYDSLTPEAFQANADIAAYVQFYFEEKMMARLKALRSRFPHVSNLVLSGGCALNCLLNSRIIREKIFDRVQIAPFPNDEGISFGAAVYTAFQKGKLSFSPVPPEDVRSDWGPSVNDMSVRQEEVRQYFPDHSIEDLKGDFSIPAKLLLEGKVIAWMQGRSEVGPRALGSRSILARADLPGIKDLLNRKVKFREGFRPYGITVIAEEVHRYFEVEAGFTSPYMSFAPRVRAEMAEKLAPVTHKDGTCRIQTLYRKQNPAFYDLLRKNQELTGLPLLLNTSLNVMGQPILEDLIDAVKFFQQSFISEMVIGTKLIRKAQ